MINILNFCLIILVLFKKVLAMVLLGQFIYVLQNMILIFYLAMIHVQNFQNLSDEITTSLDQSENYDALDDSFEDNFANLFLLGRSGSRLSMNSNNDSDEGTSVANDEEIQPPIMQKVISLKIPATKILEPLDLQKSQTVI